MKYDRHFLIILLVLGFFIAGQQVFGQFANDPIVDQIAEEARRATVHLVTEDLKREFKFDDGSPYILMRPDGGLGSGFFVDHDKIATNIHCVAGKTKIRAKLVGAEIFYDIVGVTASDPENDLVILKVAGKGPKPLSLGNSDAVQRGEPVAAVGNPEGKVEGQITHGKVYNRRNSDKWLRLMAELHPGNSGGPVLSSKGIIGIAVQSASSAYGSISYAIPSNTLEELSENSESMKPLDLEKWQRKEPILAYDYHSLAADMYETAKDLFEIGQFNSEDQKLSYQRSIELLDKAIKLYESPTFYYLRGKIYEELEQYQNAIDNYTECLNRKSDYATVYASRSSAKWKRHLYEEAIADCEKVLEFIPDDAHSYMIMGGAKLNLKRYEEAIADFGKVIDELSPNNTNVYYNRGAARYEWGRFEEASGKREAAKTQYLAAIRDFNKALKLARNNVDVYYNRGLAKYRMGKIEEASGKREAAKTQYLAAIRDFNKVLESTPNDIDAYNNLKLPKEALERLK